MITTGLLRHQHDDALSMASRLMDLIDAYLPGQGAFDILMQFSRLMGLLRVHLAHEDVELYPSLIASDDPKVVHTAEAYVAEMGGLAIDLEGFARHWSCSASIDANFEDFRDKTHDLLLALAVRIEPENLYLYPLADAEAVRTTLGAA